MCIGEVIELPVVIWRENNHYVVYIPVIGVVSQGETLEKALENVKEAVLLYLENSDEEELKRLKNCQIFITTLKPHPA